VNGARTATLAALAELAELEMLASDLRSYRGLSHKQDIQTAVRSLARSLPAAVRQGGSTLAIGDDCAALPDGEGYLLFAIEGLLGEFVAAEPWFAGWCSVMVNLSDVAAMGGRPLAVVDALWSVDTAHAAAILDGLRAAAEAYGVPVVGGHSNCHAATDQLAVAVLGRAQRLLTSFDAQPGDTLMMAVDLRGHWHDPYPFFDAATSAPPERLRADLELLPRLSEAGMCRAGKDISMAGIVGTAAMLMECSGLGGVIELDRVPGPWSRAGSAPVDRSPGDGSSAVPGAAELGRWLRAFPSYGYLLAVPPGNAATVSAHFAARDIACDSIGQLNTGHEVSIRNGDAQRVVWDLAREPLTGCPAATPGAR
jgi:AIR synthase-related protein